MTIVASRGMDQFPIRFPEGMREEIKAAAAINGRSMNREILERLSASGVGGGETLRDRFAMAALTAYLSRPDADGRPCGEIAEWCFDMADAMMADRRLGGA